MVERKPKWAKSERPKGPRGIYAGVSAEGRVLQSGSAPGKKKSLIGGFDL